MDRFFFFAAAGRTTQKKGFASLGAATDLNFDIFPDLMPIGLLTDLFGKAAKFRTRAPNHIATSCGAKPSNVCSTHHAAVHHPDSAHFAKPLLHTLNHLLDCGDIGGVAGENLITERHTFAAHHQCDVDLHTIRSVVATVAALGNGRIGETFEVGAGHIVEQ